MDYLQIEKYRLSYFVLVVLSTPPPQNVFAPLRSAFQHSATQTRISPHIANMARTIKAVLKTFSHELENKSQKSKTEKIHKKTGK